MGPVTGGGAVSPRSNHSSAQLLAEHASVRPGDVLMRYVDDGTEFTYAEFLNATFAWAGAVLGLGSEAGATIAVMLPTCPDAYFAWLGASWARMLEVPINTDYRGAMLAYVLNDSRAEVIVIAGRYLDRLASVCSELQYLRTVVVADEYPGVDLPFVTLGRDEFLQGGDGRAGDLSAPGPGEVAGVMYTSGTTGPSKGVVVPWNELSANCSCVPPDVTGRAYRLYSPWPVFHVTGKFALAECIDRDGSFVLRQRFRTEDFWTDIRDHGATVTVILGAVSNFLWSQPERSDDHENPLTHIVMGPVIPQYKEFESRFAVRIHTGFGSSEVGDPIAALHPLLNHRTCGRLVPGYEVLLVDEYGNEVGPNVAGEALVRSDDPNWMCKGYLNQPDRTAEAYAGGWFHTGDALMKDEDGCYYYIDRMKDCIRRRGENISSFEVENEVNRHPDVLESAAVAVKGDDGDDEILVLVVPDDGHNVEPGQLLEFLIPRMPRFMVPRYVEVVDNLPKTHTNRTRKVELRSRGLTSNTWDRVAAGVEVAR
jgi:crotonobetaine/carnitine-CoA ligase